MRPLYARRRLFVHPFQYRLLAANALYGLVLSLVVGCLIFVPLIIEFDTPGLSLEEKDRIAKQFLNFHQQVWPWLAATFLVIAVHSVFFVHRVAGPIYRFRMVFKAIMHGQLHVRAKLRRHDYLKPDADVLNDMLASLETKTRHVEEQLRDIQATCDALPLMIDDRNRARMTATHAALTAQLRRLHEDIEELLPGERATTETEALPSERPSQLRRAAGFTLIEIMMVVTITGTLAGIAIPNYLGYLDKVRIVRAIAEISTLSKEIDGYYYSSDETYPDSLAAIGRDTLLDPWGNPYQYLKIAGSVNGGGHAQDHERSHWIFAWLWPSPGEAYATGTNSHSGGGNQSTGSSANGSSSGGQGGGGTTGQGAGNSGGGSGNSGGSVVGQARKDRFLVPINSDYDLYSMGKDGESRAPLGAKASRDDVIRAGDGGFIGLASNF